MENKRIKEHLAHFCIAGFTYYDGAEAFNELKVGTLLNIELDDENKYDPRAVMITYNNLKLGYIPRSENRIFYKLLKTGFSVNIQLRIQRIGAQEDPEKQISVVAHLVSNS